MINKKILSILLIMLLAGCNQNNNSTLHSNSNSSKPVISTSTVSTNNNSSTTSVNSTSSSDNFNQDNFPTYSEIVDDCSIGDGLIDIDLGLKVATGAELQIGFSFSDITSEGAIVETSHPEVLKYEYVNGRHIVKGIRAGKSYITIKDYEGFIHYRKVVNVSNPLTEAEIYDHLFNVDTWYSWFAPSSLVFLENQTGIYKESDGYAITGSFEFKYKLEKIDMQRNEFIFLFTEVTEKTVEWTPVGFNVSICGDIVHMQDTNMTSDILQSTKPKYGSWN